MRGNINGCGNVVMTHELYKTSMSYLQTLLDVELSELKIKIYWEALKGMTDDEFKNAVQGIVQNYKYNKFPLPAVFFDYSRENIDVTANRAIGRLKKAALSVGPYQSVSFKDLALHAVIERFNGWTAVCSWNYDDWRINEGRVLAAYKAAVEGGDKGPEYLPGSAELQNGGEGYDKWIKPPILVDNRGRKIEYDETAKITHSTDRNNRTGLERMGAHIKHLSGETPGENKI